MITWVLVTTFLALPGAAAMPQTMGATFTDSTACEMQALRHNLVNGQSYQRCRVKVGTMVAGDAFLPTEARLAEAAQQRGYYPAQTNAARGLAMQPAVLIPAQPLVLASPAAYTAAPAPIAYVAAPVVYPQQPVFSPPLAANVAAAPGVQYASLVPMSSAGSERIAALPQTNCYGVQAGSYPAYPTRVNWPAGANRCDPGERVDRTTADDARRSLASAGYSKARDLRKGCDNVWHAKVDRGICYVGVALLPQGVVIQETD